MDRERKLLYVVAVLALILEIMTLFALQEMSGDLQLAVAARRDLVACQEHLLRAWANCPPRRERHAWLDQR
jgi:hypothetical protein